MATLPLYLSRILSIFIEVPYFSLIEVVTFLAINVCTPGIEKTITNKTNNPIKINRMRLIIFLNFLISF